MKGWVISNARGLRAHDWCVCVGAYYTRVVQVNVNVYEVELASG